MSGGTLTPEEARGIAQEAYIYAYSIVHGYRALHWLGVRKGGFNKLGHYRKIVDPSDDLNMEVQINLDTLYSQTPLDLRAEPLVLTVPDFDGDRYFSFQFSDFYMHNFAYIGTRTTGQGGGSYLIAGPDWEGEIPSRLTGVIRSETNILYSLLRILCRDKADEPDVNALQDRFKLEPLSAYLDRPPALPIQWEWKWPSRTMLLGTEIFSYFNFLLQLIDQRESERDLFKRFAGIGIEAGKEYDISHLPLAVQSAILKGAEEAHDRLKDACKNIGTLVNGWAIVPRIRGNSDLLSGCPENYFKRAVQAMFGIYGVDLEECVYLPSEQDSQGEILDASKHNYVLHLPRQPPCRGFWSLTAYDRSTQFLVRNEIERYAISNRTQGVAINPDGSMTLYLQHNAPQADKRSNWLPVPAKELFMVLRLYIPDQEAIDAVYVPPPIERMT